MAPDYWIYGPANVPVLTGYDAEYRVVVELTMDGTAGYATRAGVELPRNGVTARRT